MIFRWKKLEPPEVVDSADPDRIGDSKEELRLMLEAGSVGRQAVVVVSLVANFLRKKPQTFATHVPKKYMEGF